MANSKRTKTKVAPVQQQEITPQNMAMIQQMQDMQAAENQQKILHRKRTINSMIRTVNRHQIRR